MLSFNNSAFFRGQVVHLKPKVVHLQHWEGG